MIWGWDIHGEDRRKTEITLLEQGGKSSWGNAEVKGIVVIEKTVQDNRNSYKYYVMMVDSVGRGIGAANESTGVPTLIINNDDTLNRSNVATTDADGRSKFYEEFKEVTYATKIDDASSGSAIGTAATDNPVVCHVVM